ncbi:MAG: hypothetical protein O7D91_16300 [Planctomycetota bacterium]|nr:hypothetical protein [Planctomycetota bacterium]
MAVRLLSATGPSAHQTGDAATLWNVAVLLGTTAVLLAVFFLGVMLLTRSHQRRQDQRKRRSSAGLTDPWREAGRRVMPDDYHSPDEDGRSS